MKLSLGEIKYIENKYGKSAARKQISIRRIEKIKEILNGIRLK